MKSSLRKSVADVDGFIEMLMAAAEDSAVRQSLSVVLKKPSPMRKSMIHQLASDLHCRNAPQVLIEALACLEDDRIASKVLELILNDFRKIS